MNNPLMFVRGIVLFVLMLSLVGCAKWEPIGEAEASLDPTFKRSFTARIEFKDAAPGARLLGQWVLNPAYLFDADASKTIAVPTIRYITEGEDRLLADKWPLQVVDAVTEKGRTVIGMAGETKRDGFSHTQPVEWIRLSGDQSVDILVVPRPESEEQQQAKNTLRSVRLIVESKGGKGSAEVRIETVEDPNPLLEERGLD